ncbi:MAG: ATP-binding protein [Oleiphilaceae bacterium]|nr:ATP-binding protein [Oleiphilaceae bacterium]
MKTLGIRGQLIVMVITAVVASILAASLFIRDIVYDQILDQKRTTTEILTASVVHDIKYEFNFRKQVAINSIISKYLTYYRIINGIHYYTLSDNRIVDVYAPSITVLEQNPVDDEHIAQAIKKARPNLAMVKTKDSGLIIRSIAPVLQGSRVIGAIDIQLSIDDINDILSSIMQRIYLIMLVVLSVAIAILFLFLRSSLLQRLTRLMRMTREVSSGNYAIKIEDPSHDELGLLTRSFNQMTEDLLQSRLEIESHNRQLDQKVKDATAELQTAYEDLKNAQSQIVLSEKMASLGVLIAGIAHEINTPVGAISNMSLHMRDVVTDLPDILVQCVQEKLDTARLSPLLAEVIESASRIESPPHFKTVREVEGVLREAGIEEWRERASTLASFHFVNTEKVKQYIDCFASDAAFGLFEVTGYIANSASICRTSSHKIQDIIQALKFYAYTDKDRVEPTNLNESIQTALVLNKNRLKHGVDVQLDFDNSLPSIPCTSEIHQIWTVLINNALDEFDKRGEDFNGCIGIRTFVEHNQACVSVKDNGGGIPQNIIDKIFDPFFTTKDIGKGTGLGLSIVSGIVKKHGGNIDVATKGGHTTFTVRIPVEGLGNGGDNEIRPVIKNSDATS